MLGSLRMTITPPTPGGGLSPFRCPRGAFHHASWQDRETVLCCAPRQEGSVSKLRPGDKLDEDGPAMVAVTHLKHLPNVGTITFTPLLPGEKGKPEVSQVAAE